MYLLCLCCKTCHSRLHRYSFVGGLRPGSPTFSEANQRDVRKRKAGSQSVSSRALRICFLACVCRSSFSHACHAHGFVEDACAPSIWVCGGSRVRHAFLVCGGLAGLILLRTMANLSCPHSFDGIAAMPTCASRELHGVGGCQSLAPRCDWHTMSHLFFAALLRRPHAEAADQCSGEAWQVLRRDRVWLQQEERGVLLGPPHKTCWFVC